MWERALPGKGRRTILSLSLLGALDKAKTQCSVHCSFSCPHLYSEHHGSCHSVYSGHSCHIPRASLVLAWSQYDLRSTHEWHIFCPVNEYICVYLKLFFDLFGFFSLVAFSLFGHLGCSPLMQLLGSLEVPTHNIHIILVCYLARTFENFQRDDLQQVDRGFSTMDFFPEYLINAHVET